MNKIILIFLLLVSVANTGNAAQLSQSMIQRFGIKHMWHFNVSAGNVNDEINASTSTTLVNAGAVFVTSQYGQAAGHIDDSSTMRIDGTGFFDTGDSKPVWIHIYMKTNVGEIGFNMPVMFYDSSNNLSCLEYSPSNNGKVTWAINATGWSEEVGKGTAINDGNYHSVDIVFASAVIYTLYIDGINCGTYTLDRSMTNSINRAGITGHYTTPSYGGSTYIDDMFYSDGYLPTDSNVKWVHRYQKGRTSIAEY